ncbi:MAG: LysR family transcriptional regulator [Burkholderiales bacterium]|nr:MAG: LysR family transcriptional regulator [Burkholderiales bacterium]
MDIAQLKTLIHVAELGSISRAAERLGIAQPALSRQIRLVETELGAALFTRHGRGMILTELGVKVLGPASEILAQLDSIRRIAADSATSLLGRVRVGVTPTVAEVATLPLVRAIRDTHPGLSLCFTSGFSGHLMEWLKRGELDCCVAYGAQSSALITTQRVLEEALLLVGGRDRHLAMNRPHSFASLVDEALVLPSPAHDLRTILDTCASRAGIRLTPSIEPDSLTAMIDLVRGGFGLTILPLAPIHTRLLASELTAAPLIDPQPSRCVLIAYPADRPIMPAARFVGDTFVRIAGELVGNGIWAGTMIDATAHAHATAK